MALVALVILDLGTYDPPVEHKYSAVSLPSFLIFVFLPALLPCTKGAQSLLKLVEMKLVLY
jgi:hypothetical protein